jgi:hypothetical protein
MERSERIRRLSGALRYLLIAASAALAFAMILAVLTTGQEWLSFGDDRITQLWNTDSDLRPALALVILPIPLMLFCGVYWLQRLFGEYHVGHFFKDSTMRCYLWLVWLKVAFFVYEIIWPNLLELVSGYEPLAEVSIAIDAGAFVELVVLLLIVHLLKEAQKINDENQAFV